MKQTIRGRKARLLRGRQVALGTPQAAMTLELPLADGTWAYNDETVSEGTFDGYAFASPFETKSSVDGRTDGLRLQGTYRAIMAMFGDIFGNEAVSAPDPLDDDLVTRTLTEGDDPYTATYQKSLGTGALSVKHQFAESRLSRVALEVGIGQRIARLEVDGLSADPAVPLAAIDEPNFAPEYPLRPFTLGDLRGSVVLGGINLTEEVSHFRYAVARGVEGAQGESVRYFGLLDGEGLVEAGVTAWFTDEVRRLWNLIVFGNENPAAGAKPIEDIPNLAFVGSLSHGEVAEYEGIDFDIPLAAVSTDSPLAPTREGGVDVAFVLRARRGAGQPSISTLVGKNADVGSY